MYSHLILNEVIGGQYYYFVFVTLRSKGLSSGSEIDKEYCWSVRKLKEVGRYILGYQPFASWITIDFSTTYFSLLNKIEC